VLVYPKSDLGCLGVEVYRSHTIRHTHTHTHTQTVGLPWANDKLVAEAAAYKNIQHSQ